MLEPGRSSQVSNSTPYRFSINGQEKSDEIAPNTTTAEYWEYDARIQRRWNIDPAINTWESGYLVFHNNPIRYNDPNGDSPPEKPGFWQRLWHGVNNEYYKTRADKYANEHGIDENNIIDVGKNTLVVIDDKNPKDIRFNVFRMATSGVLSFTSSKNDDLNLTSEQLSKTKILGDNVILWTGLGGAGAAEEGLVLMGGKLSKGAIVGVVNKTANAIQNYKKLLRFCVGDADLLNKGYHLHFDQIAKDLELGLKPLQDGGIGLVQVGKLSVGTAEDIKNAVTIFNRAMMNAGFRDELLVRLKATQEYLQDLGKFGGKTAQLGIDKAHEVNYLIKAVLKFQ